MKRRVKETIAITLLCSLVLGCRDPLNFPAQSMPDKAQAVKAAEAYDADHDGKADFFTYAGTTDRIARIGFDRTGDEAPDVTINLDNIPFNECRHLVIILDGFGYDVVADYYADGGLRMFHPPSRVVAPYPTMTDVCLEDALGYMPCQAVEALYYDRSAHKVVGGAWAYMRGTNQPYNRLLQYRANLIWDAVGYVRPMDVFGKEINDAKRLFDKARTRELLAYFVSSAGVGTQRGAEGQRQCLQRIDQLVKQVVRETRGLVKVTLLSDHGHSYTPSRPIALESHLTCKNWQITNRLKRPRDVVYLRFGLVTYAAFATNDPAGLAKDLIECQGTELASYAQDDHVVVLAAGGQQAIVRRIGDRYKYEPLAGDPLSLAGILAAISTDSQGTVAAEAMLPATVDHTWPAPLQRLWRAHFSLVANPPDVIVSLADGYYSGSASFARTVNVASTHGGLNRRNSLTFIMSTAGPLPTIMRSADIPAHMKTLIGRPWPMKE
ncbi:MAG: hypothetical protein HQ546_01865 [Planctomycetes bacterium]|nr:hypothetical protein [Planctomycetota bacterium]